MRSDIHLAGLDPLGMGGVDPYMGAAQDFSVVPQSLMRRLPNQAQRMPTPIQGYSLNPTDTRNLPAVPLPVDSGAVLIAAAATAIIQVTPVSNVRITDFSVASAVAPNFVINAILAGRVNMFCGAGSVPAERYTADSNRPPMEVPRVPAGTIIQVSVTNISGAASRFLGVFDCLDLTYTVGR